MLQGSVFDCLVTVPELYSELFIEWNKPFAMPSGKIKTIVEDYHKQYPEDTELNPDKLLPIITKHDYQKNWKDATKLKNIILTAHGQIYLSYLLEKGERKLVTTNERLRLSEYANEVRYQFREILETADTQVPLYWNTLGVDCKGLLDIVVEDEAMIGFFDLKLTSLPLEDYMQEIRRRRSDIQLSFYAEGLRHHYPGKKIVGQLMVFSTANKQAQLFEISDLDLEIARYGAVRNAGTITYKDNEIPVTYRIKGWEQGLSPQVNSYEQTSIWQ